jgi:hypothetical protein
MNRALKAMIVFRFGTQEDFAKAIGENPSIVSRVIRGRYTLSADKKSTWASTLQFEIKSIFPKDDVHE